SQGLGGAKRRLAHGKRGRGRPLRREYHSVYLDAHHMGRPEARRSDKPWGGFARTLRRAHCGGPLCRQPRHIRTGSIEAVNIVSHTKYHPALSPIEEVIEDARNGRMFILVEAEDAR